MENPAAQEITRLLHAWRGGDREAIDRLIPLVYDELHTLANEWRHDRLQTTTVVHEAYVRLFNQPNVDWQNRGHFFAIAAQVMRRVLVDHARRALREKRGGRTVHVGLDDVQVVADQSPVDSWTRLRSTAPCTNWKRWTRTRADRRAAVLRGIDRRGDSRRARDLAGDGQARVGDRESVAVPPPVARAMLVLRDNSVRPNSQGDIIVCRRPSPPVKLHEFLRHVWTHHLGEWRPDCS